MRLSDHEAANAIRDRLDLVGRTGLSIVYTEKVNSKSARGFGLSAKCTITKTFEHVPS